MAKRWYQILVFLIIVSCLAAACSSDIKVGKRDPYGEASLTPFLPKATFTHVSMEEDLGGGLNTHDPYLTWTVEPTVLNETSEAELDDQKSLTPAISTTPESSSPGNGTSQTPITPSVTSTPVTPSTPLPSSTPTATLKPGIPTYTPEPPTATSTSTPTPTPTLTHAPTNTPRPSNTSVPTNTPVPAGCSPSGNSTYENQVITLINQERTDRGLSALNSNSSLTQAARRHSEDMACNDFFSHTGSDGSTLSSRVLAAGYSFSWVAENIAASSNCSFSAQSVVNMWMNSTGHRNNILSANGVHIGVGFRCASDSIGNDFDAYYTADFGRP